MLNKVKTKEHTPVERS